MSTVQRSPIRVNVPSYRPPSSAPAGARKPRTVKPAHGVARLTVTIHDTDYAARPLKADPGSDVSHLVQLRNLTSGEVYHASAHEHGLECTCPSWTFDRDGTGEPCKHLAALVACSLLPDAPPAWPDERYTVVVEGGVL